MDQKPKDKPAIDQEEAAVSEVPPKKDPTKAAGSLNPREKTAFYEAVAQKSRKRKTW
jgi:hypothetical protein